MIQKGFFIIGVDLTNNKQVMTCFYDFKKLKNIKNIYLNYNNNNKKY